MLEKLIVFVEEYSMETLLEMLLPEMLGDIEYQIIRFQCKDDLLKQLPTRLKGYQYWIPDNWSMLVLVDRDEDDCRELKEQLEQYARNAGFITKTSASSGQSFRVVNRIVIEELEAWYFGDWNAVKGAYPRVSPTIPEKAKFRNPDAIPGGTWEAFEQVMKQSGYFSTGLRKTECAREIGKLMDVSRNDSHSCNKFYSAIQSIISAGYEY